MLNKNEAAKRTKIKIVKKNQQIRIIIATLTSFRSDYTLKLKTKEQQRKNKSHTKYYNKLCVESRLPTPSCRAVVIFFFA